MHTDSKKTGSLADLLLNISVLEAEGRVLNSKNLLELQDAILKLNRILESAMRREAETMANQVVPSIRVTAKGISLVGFKKPKLYAGERLGTFIEKTMEEKGLDAKVVVEGLPIRIDAFKRIQSGLNSRPPDDVLEAIAKALDMSADDLKDLADLDKTDPVENFFF